MVHYSFSQNPGPLFCLQNQTSTCHPHRILRPIFILSPPYTQLFNVLSFLQYVKHNKDPISSTYPFGKLRGTEWTTLSGSFIMWLRLNPGTRSFFLVDRRLAWVVKTRRNLPSRAACCSRSSFAKAVRSRKDPDLHSGALNVTPRRCLGTFTCRRALRDMTRGSVSLVIVGRRELLCVSNVQFDVCTHDIRDDVFKYGSSLRSQ